MGEKPLTLSEVIGKMLDPRGKVLDSDLASLSGLGTDDLNMFKKNWKELAADQRTNLVIRLFSLSEEDLTLDFARIFNFCIEDPEESVRIKAIAGLELEDRHVYITPLIRAMKTDESAEVRSAAAQALGKFALKAALDELPDAVAQDIFMALLEVLENAGESISVRRRALEAIAPFRQEPVEQYLEDFYYSEDPKVKASAIYAMGRNCDHRWLEFLMDEMQSGNAQLRYEAAQAIGELEDEEVVPYLLKLLNDEDQEVQEAAIRSLGQIGGRDARQALNRLIKSSDTRIKDAAKSALAELLSCEDQLSLNF